MRARIKTLIMFVLFGIVVWIADAVADYYMFYKGNSFLDLLILHPPPHEIYIRSVILVLFFVAGIVFSSVVADLKKEHDAILIIKDEYKDIFNSLMDGVVLAKKDTKKFSLPNKRICEMLGYSAQEIETLGIEDIHPKEDLDSVMEGLQKQMSGEKSLFRNSTVKRKDGTVFYADINSIPVTLGAVDYMVGVFRDVSEIIEGETKLRAKNEELEKINKMMVGRELRMEGLKREIAELNAVINSQKEYIDRLQGDSKK
ncbi:MAG: PAS domain S-box protein [Candidatus Ancaeobacter aquaticus]|nr:PAS domain S-box protein [Candidatus Ancaeobacter aquaticus]